jgi:Rieske 2Fe-2S family protein
MSLVKDAIQTRLQELIAAHRPGWSLPRDFYSAEEVYRADLERIWRSSWLFAGHSCEIAKPGDYFTLDVDANSIVVLRGEDGLARALHNVCRHRGSLICTEACGHLTRLVCPYHQWSYGLDGRLLAARGMPADFDKEQFGLQALPTHEEQGLIFFSLAGTCREPSGTFGSGSDRRTYSEEPPPFEPARDMLAPLLQPQGLRRAKVAKAVDYLIKANWKLVWENNRECFHCNVNHPQYIKANFDHYNSDDTSPRIAEQIANAVRRMETKWAAAGLTATHKQTGMIVFPDAERDVWYSANRTVLVDGYVSETMDGRQCAPLMGDYQDADVGTLRVRTLPNFWNHSSCDHSVSTRLLPAGPQLTAARVCWMVDEQAVEGRDYQLAELMPFWQLTSEQDWHICERQQRGVNSSAYTPGPYSTWKEYNVDSFVRWYLKMLARADGARR